MEPKLPKGTLDKLWSDPVNWRGPFYYCKSDPRKVVPKRVKWTGWTINCAHPSGWLGILFRVALIGSAFLYLKEFGHDGWIYGLLAAVIVYSWWDGRRKSSPDRYEEPA